MRALAPHPQASTLTSAHPPLRCPRPSRSPALDAGPRPRSPLATALRSAPRPHYAASDPLSPRERVGVRALAPHPQASTAHLRPSLPPSRCPLPSDPPRSTRGPDRDHATQHTPSASSNTLPPPQPEHMYLPLIPTTITSKEPHPCPPSPTHTPSSTGALFLQDRNPPLSLTPKGHPQPAPALRHQRTPVRPVPGHPLPRPHRRTLRPRQRRHPRTRLRPLRRPVRIRTAR